MRTIHPDQTPPDEPQVHLIALLKKAGWAEDGPMVVQGQLDRPVFSRGIGNGFRAKVIVGTLWTTHYKLKNDTIYDQDSTKTSDIEAVKQAIGNLFRTQPE